MGEGFGTEVFTIIKVVGETAEITQIIKYRIIQNDCRGYNNLSYTIHFR